MTRKIAALMIATALVSGCSAFKSGTKKKTPVLGERVAVLVNEAEIQIDPQTAAMDMVLPEPVANADWGQEGARPAHDIGHVALGQTLGQAFAVSIGEGTSLSARLAAGPVVAGNKLFTIDTRSTVRAFDATSGALLWSQRFGIEDKNENSLFGGGVAVENGTLYATNGLGFAVAMDPANGALKWSVRPGGPLRGAPTVDGDAVYVLSQDNQLYSLKTHDGTTNWSNAAALEVAGVFGSASPAVSRGTVVAGFSSGELNAYRYENGRQVWQDALSRTSITTSVSSLSDVDAGAVIDNGIVYALGKGGRMVAIDLVTGQRLWEISVAGISTPWVAGDWLFAVTDQAQVIAVAKQTGRVRWINQLPKFEKEKSKKGPISYVGPILAGGRLVLAGSNGALISINPQDGGFINQIDGSSGVSVPMAVAGQTLYVLGDDGKVRAFR